MRMALSRGPENTIAVPERLAQALGNACEVEVEEVSGGLLLRPETEGLSREVQLRAVREFMASGPQDVAAFSELEIAELRAWQHAVEQAEAEQILASFDDGDLPA